MKIIRKIFKVLGLLLLSAVLLIAAADAAWIYVPQIKAVGKSGDVDAYARSTGDITVPGSPEIIALGEAITASAPPTRSPRMRSVWAEAIISVSPMFPQTARHIPLCTAR